MKCPSHDEIVRGQARLEEKVDGLKEDVTAIKNILTGPNGTNGLVGAYNKARGGWWVVCGGGLGALAAAWTFIKEVFGKG